MEHIKMLSILTTALVEIYGRVASYLWEVQHPKHTVIGEYEGNRIMDNPEIHCLKQLWGDTGCGWSGMAGQMFTTSDVIVIAYKELNIAAVYIKKFAYFCEIDDEYEKCLKNANFPGHRNLEKTKLKILKKA